jgi:hypothetical protein
LSFSQKEEGHSLSCITAIVKNEESWMTNSVKKGDILPLFFEENAYICTKPVRKAEQLSSLSIAYKKRRL